MAHPTLDGTPQYGTDPSDPTSTAALSTATGLTTSLNDDIVVAIAGTLANGSTPDISGITVGGTAMAKRNTLVETGCAFGLNLMLSWWWLHVPSPLVAAAVTATFAPGGNGNMFGKGLIAFAVNGCNLTTPWDPNGSLSGTYAKATSGGPPYTVSGIGTTNPTPFVIAACVSDNNNYNNTGGVVVPDTSFTVLRPTTPGAIGSYFDIFAEYAALTSALSNASVGVDTNRPSGGGHIAFVDALQASPALVQRGFGLIVGL